MALSERDGRLVGISGGIDATVRLWDLDDGQCLDELPMPNQVGCLALSRRGTLIVGFGPDIAVFDANVTPDNYTSRDYAAQNLASRARQSWWKRPFTRF